MEFPTEVGLQLIRYPLNSKLVLRTACCSVGIAMPVYSTFKAIERDDRDEQKKCLVYWSAFGAFSVAEVFTDKILSWFPMYYHVKFAFLIWLQLPSTNGSACLYWNYLRPFLLRHQVRLDHIAEVLNSIMSLDLTTTFSITPFSPVPLQARFIAAGEENFHLAKVIFLKTLASGILFCRSINPNPNL
ncbi:HVA22-like protein k [Linum perenne]